jgi:UDP-4-amino-4,6-dideoxy-N-acetyl-beta-L-altrosamine transaminase
MSHQKIYTYGKQSISWRDIWEVVKVLRSPWLTQGPKIKEFEDALCAYTGVQYAVMVSSGAAALHLAALCMNINPGDEVITSPITFLASANCILYAGGVVKFADIDPTTACIDPRETEKQITPKTRGIIPVHFAGHPCDMEQLAALAQRRNLFIIEDGAHAIGSEYKGSKIGACKYSDATIFSFHPVKTITTGEGGAITTNNKDMYEKLLRLRSHGITKDPLVLTKNDGLWYYEMHDLGFNYRMSGMQAALGLSQLKRLEGFVQKRKEIVAFYRKAFAGDDRFALLEEKDYATKVAYHLCPLLINFAKVSTSKKEIFNALQQQGINLQVHYIPVHTQPFYQKLGFKNGDCSVAEAYYKKTLSLPVYPGLKGNDLEFIVETIKELAA